MRRRRYIDRRPTGTVRIMVNPEDISRDRYLDREEAEARFAAGDLVRDESGAYRTKSLIVPAFLRDAKIAG